MVVSEKPGSILLEEIWNNFALKKDLIGPPSKYLGGKIQRVEMENVQEFWVFRYTQYVQTTVQNVK